MTGIDVLIQKEGMIVSGQKSSFDRLEHSSQTRKFQAATVIPLKQVKTIHNLQSVEKY